MPPFYTKRSIDPNRHTVITTRVTMQDFQGMYMPGLDCLIPYMLIVSRQCGHPVGAGSARA